MQVVSLVRSPQFPHARAPLHLGGIHEVMGGGIGVTWSRFIGL